MIRLLLAFFFIPMVAIAESVPRPGSADPRVRSINYNPSQVYRLNTAIGVLTGIQFEDDELVTNDIMPDPTVWDAKKVGNHLFIKPLSLDANTNLTVLTSKRTYTFELNVLPMNTPKNQLVYSLVFRYTDVEQKKLAEKQAVEEAKEAKETVEKRFDTALERKYNENYWGAGDTEIFPTAAHDDGNFVWLEFGYNGDMPAIYEVGKDGSESIVNSHTEGNTVVIERMAHKYVLRRGDLAVSVINQSWIAGRDNKTGTVATDVDLVVKEAQ